MRFTANGFLFSTRSAFLLHEKNVLCCTCAYLAKLLKYTPQREGNLSNIKVNGQLYVLSKVWSKIHGGRWSTFLVIWRALVREMSMVWQLRSKLHGHLHAWQCCWVLSGLFCLAWAALVSACYGHWQHQFPKPSALLRCPLYPGTRVFSIP